MYGGSTPETMVAQCLPPPLSTFIDDNIARKREKKREKVSLLCPETRSLRRKLVLLLLNKLWSAVVSGQQRQHMMYNLFFVDNIIALPIGKRERECVRLLFGGIVENWRQLKKWLLLLSLQLEKILLLLLLLYNGYYYIFFFFPPTF